MRGSNRDANLACESVYAVDVILCHVFVQSASWLRQQTPLLNMTAAVHVRDDLAG